MISSLPPNVCVPYTSQPAPCELIRTLLCGFELTDMVLTQQPQSMSPVGPNKGMCTKSSLSALHLDLPSRHAVDSVQAL